MIPKALSRLQCPYCKAPLTVTFSSNKAKVLTCKCSEYPYLNGILYLKKDIRAGRSVRLIKQNRAGIAAIYLAKTKVSLVLPTVLFLLQKNNVKFVSFVSIFRFFGYDALWAKYLTTRQKATSFRLSILAARALGKSATCLDFGCGIGQLLPYIVKQIGPGKCYGLDNSFLHLLIARRFFASPKTLLICADGESGLPFKNAALNSVITTDTFHYITEKKYFLKEMLRILSAKGSLVTIHTINAAKRVYGNIMGIKATSVRTVLTKIGFTNIRILAENSPDGDIKNAHSPTKIKANEPYTFSATKNS